MDEKEFLYISSDDKLAELETSDGFFEEQLPITCKKELSLIERIAVIKQYEQESVPNTANLAQKFNVSRYQILTTIRFKDDYLREWRKNPDISRVRRSTPPAIRALAIITLHFYKKCKTDNYIVTEFSLKFVASTIAKLLDITNFRASNRWFGRFNSKYKLKLDPDTPENRKHAFRATQNIKIEDLIIEKQYALPKEVQVILKHLQDLNIDNDKIMKKNVYKKFNGERLTKLPSTQISLSHAKRDETENVLFEKKFECNTTTSTNLDNIIDNELSKFSEEENINSQAISVITFLYYLKCKEYGYNIAGDTLKYAAYTAAQLLDIKDLEFFAKKSNVSWFERFKMKYKLVLTNHQTDAARQSSYEALQRFNVEDIIIDYKSKLPKIFQQNIHFDVSRIPKSRADTKHNKVKTYENKKLPLNKIVEKEMELDTVNELHKISNIQNDSEIMTGFDYWYAPTQNIDNDLYLETFSHNNNTENIKEMSNNTSINFENSKSDKNIVNENCEAIKHEVIKKRKVQNNSKNNKNHNTITFGKPSEEKQIPTTDTSARNFDNIVIKNVEEAIKYLKPLEEFALLTSNFRAINYVTCLEDVFKNIEKQ